MLSQVQKLLLGFVTLIVGLVFVSQISTVGSSIITAQYAPSEAHTLVSGLGINSTDINESTVYTVTYPPTSWKVQDCPLSNVVIKNVTGASLVETTNYVFTTTSGTYTLVNSADTLTFFLGDVADGNTTYVSYNYCGDDYMNLSWGRSIIALVPGFLALALLIFSVGMFYSLAKDSGIL